MVLRNGGGSCLTICHVCSFPSSSSTAASATIASARRAPLRRDFSSSTSPHQLLATKLSDRSVLSLRGANTYKLLQGLVTNDVRRLEERATSPSASSSAQTSAHTSAFYCGFLNPQGRLIGPAFLYNEGTFAATSDPAAPPSVLMDCHSANVPSLQTFIKRFMLRSKVKLADESEGWETWAIWSDDASSRDEEAMRSLEQEGKVLRDARTPRMGWRLLSPRNSTPPLPIAVQHRSPLAYTRHRIAQGVPDGPVELHENSSLPLEANLDLMGGVDYKKGCYVGQELTARTHHIGVVRKRFMPVRLHPSEGTGKAGLEGLEGATIRSPPAATSSSRRAKPAGTLLVAEQAYATEEEREAEVKGKLDGGEHLTVPPGATAACEATANPQHATDGEMIGLAMLRLQHVVNAEQEGAAGLTLSVGDAENEKTFSVKASWPDWWPASIREKVLNEGADS